MNASPALPLRRRRAAMATALALVAALLTFGAPLGASAEVVGDGPGTVSGTVTTSNGDPMEGVYVNASTSFGQGTIFSATVATDASGAYSFEGLPVDNYTVNTSATGYQPAGLQFATISVESPTATINFVLTPFVAGVGTITGQVTADGVPVANVGVSINNMSTFQSFYTSADENGAFAFSELSTGQWQVNAYVGPGYQFLDPQFAELTDLAPAAIVDLAYVSWPTGTAAISGTLTDSATGLPLAGVHVGVYGNDVAHQSSTTTDESGVYTVDLLPEGTYTLSYNAMGYLLASTEVQTTADQTVTADRALVPANAAISGHVKAKDGSAIAGIYVDAHTSDGNIGGAVTDENGDYVIDGLGAVEYTLTVGGLGTPYKQKQKPVTAVANGSATANFTLKTRTTGSLGGMVFASNGEYYTAPVCVKLYSPTKKNPIAEVRTYGPEYGDGTFSFDSVKPGSYTVQFEDCDDDPATLFDTAFLGGATLKQNATFVTVIAGQDSWDNNFTIEPRSTTSTISGHVEKNNGAPLAGLVVQATDGIASSASAITDANGNYTIVGLFTDRYTVTVGGIATPYVQKEKTVTTIEDASVTANFSLKKR